MCYMADEEKEIKLTAKQERFCEEYLMHQNIGLASMLSKHILQNTPEDGYFVYFLADPDSSTVFYVGKGKGRRPYNHLTDSATTKGANVKKREIIRRIHAVGNQVDIFYFATGLTEKAAYFTEKAVIKKIGRTNLTNISGGTNKQTEADRARLILSRVKKLSTFCAENRPPDQVELYLKIVRELKMMAA